MSDNDQSSARANRVVKASPAEMHDPALRREIAKAGIWIGLAVGVYLIAILAQPILLIFGALVLATMLDGGARLLGRILPIPRGFRLAIVAIAVFAFIGWTFWLTGSQLGEQVSALQSTVLAQIDRIGDWAARIGLTATPNDLKNIGQQVLGSVGQLTRAVTTVFGFIAALGMITVLGLFIAAEPRLYERGVAWMVPSDKRGRFYGTASKMGYTMRRLMAGRIVGMVIEGVGTWFFLMLGGVPMAALLGILTGLLAFIPNLGAIVSGILIISVGFSAGVDVGIYAVFVYMGVQMIDAYLIVPMVAKRAVDLAPALVLSAQILLGTLFGILGLALADPIVAMIKVFLERRAEHEEEDKPIQIEGH